MLRGAHGSQTVGFSFVHSSAGTSALSRPPLHAVLTQLDVGEFKPAADAYWLPPQLDSSRRTSGQASGIARSDNSPPPHFWPGAFFSAQHRPRRPCTPRRGVRPHDTHNPFSRQRARSRRWRARLSARQAPHRRRPVAVAAQQIVQIDSAVRRASNCRLRVAVSFRPGLYRCRALSRQRTQHVWPSTARSPHRAHSPSPRRCEIRRRLNPLSRFAAARFAKPPLEPPA